MESVACLASVTCWISERFDDLVKLYERTWPPMHNHQRKGVGISRPAMYKVNVKSVDIRCELLKSVQLPFLLSPVVLIAPVRHQFPQVGEIGSIGPSSFVELIREACVSQAFS